MSVVMPLVRSDTKRRSIQSSRTGVGRPCPANTRRVSGGQLVVSLRKDLTRRQHSDVVSATKKIRNMVAKTSAMVTHLKTSELTGPRVGGLGLPNTETRIHQ